MQDDTIKNDEELPKADATSIDHEPEVGSVVARLRELREEQAEQVTHDLEVPGYKGMLVARYAPLPWPVVRNLALRADRGRRDSETAPMIAADGLANAVEGFFFRDDSGLTAVTYNGDPITKYDDALAKALGIENASTVREIVRAVFPDEFSLVSHYGEFMEWQGTRDDGDEGLAEAAKLDPTVHPTSR